ncbi:MAG TPA: hypothetical protein VJZ71_06610 [Phycisphaerae bacterium]|nr:hypothetical protein [Phycisphaerae bacterium]
MNHKWSEDDDLIGYYLFRFGDAGLGTSKQELADRLGMGWASMNQKIANYKFLAGQPGLDHPSIQSRQIHSRYKDMPDDAFKTIGQKAIANALEKLST